MIFLYIALGAALGIAAYKYIPLIGEYLMADRRKKWRVRFHTYFIIHENGQRTNSSIKTPSVDIYVSASSESEAGDLVIEMIEKEFRVEIESIEHWVIQ